MSCFRQSLPFLRSVKSLAHGGSLLAALTLLGASACSKAPAEGDCEKLLHHLVEIEVNNGLADEPNRKKHKVNLTEAVRENFVERCNTELKAKQVTCTLKAKTSKEIEACDS